MYLMSRLSHYGEADGLCNFGKLRDKLTRGGLSRGDPPPSKSDTAKLDSVLDGEGSPLFGPSLIQN